MFQEIADLYPDEADGNLQTSITEQQDDIVAQLQALIDLVKSVVQIPFGININQCIVQGSGAISGATINSGNRNSGCTYHSIYSTASLSSASLLSRPPKQLSPSAYGK